MNRLVDVQSGICCCYCIDDMLIYMMIQRFDGMMHCVADGSGTS